MSSIQFEPQRHKGRYALARELPPVYTDQSLHAGGDLASTWVAKPVVHAEVRATS